MSIDLKIPRKIICILAMYLSHAGYVSNYFQSILDDVERLTMETCDKRSAIMIEDDFNLWLINKLWRRPSLSCQGTLSLVSKISNNVFLIKIRPC